MFAAFAPLLAVIGIYGIVSYALSTSLACRSFEPEEEQANGGEKSA
jgi:hypothetical protein